MVSSPTWTLRYRVSPSGIVFTIRCSAVSVILLINSTAVDERRSISLVQTVPSAFRLRTPSWDTNEYVQRYPLGYLLLGELVSGCTQDVFGKPWTGGVGGSHTPDNPTSQRSLGDHCRGPQPVLRRSTVWCNKTSLNLYCFLVIFIHKSRPNEEPNYRVFGTNLTIGICYLEE